MHFYPRPPRGGRHPGYNIGELLGNFYPRPPRGGRLSDHQPGLLLFSISIHALREEGDTLPRATIEQRLHFYPRPPRGGRHEVDGEMLDYFLFLSTPSARRATFTARQSAESMKISIHALREEGDFSEGARVSALRISIHALREEGDNLLPGGRHLRDISIHALREEGDGIPSTEGVTNIVFLSTPSARRATEHRHGGRRSVEHFYPRPPRGGRLFLFPFPASRRRFLSTPSARRATFTTAGISAASLISIHALREEGDQDGRSRRGRAQHFYPRPPRGGRLARFEYTCPGCKNFYPRPPRGGRPA